MAKYEVEIIQCADKDKMQHYEMNVPIIVRVFEDGQLLAEIRSKRSPGQ